MRTGERLQLGMRESRHNLMRLAAALILLSPAMFAAKPPSLKHTVLTPQEKSLLSALPLRFEQDAQTRWTARGAGYSFLFDRGATILQLGDRAVTLNFAGANADAPYAATGRNLAPTNYFIGRTYRSAAAYSRLSRTGVYPGIDVIYYGNGGHLEYDFDLAPGADPARIRMRFEGADRVSLGKDGQIVLQLGSGTVEQPVPVVYQKSHAGAIEKVEARYRMLADGSIGVDLGRYDRAKALVIDPSIVYAIYLSGSNADVATEITHDANGFVYLGGYTYSPDFPQTGIGAYQPVQYPGVRNCWLMKLNPFTDPADQIAYMTYFGANLDTDLRGMAVDASGVIYFGGVTLASNLPVLNAFQSALGSTNVLNNAFVAVIDPKTAGSAGLLYCSYYGGTQDQEVEDVATAGGKLYITGWTNTPDLPMAGSTYQSTEKGDYDAFAAEFDPTQSGKASLVYASYLGGSQQDIARSLTVDASGNMWIAGYTFSTDFPVSANALISAAPGEADAFLAEMNPATGALTYSTYLGGTGLDVATKIKLDSAGRPVVSGYTYSQDLPLTPNAAQPVYGGNGDAFITAVDPSQSGYAQLIYSTYYGGSGTEVAYGLAIDSAGRYFICGYTLSQDLPVTQDAIQPAAAAQTVNAFVAGIDPANTLAYASYITGPGYQVAYGVDTDSSNRVYVTGLATSDIYPGANPPHPGGAGKFSAFLEVVAVGAPTGSAVPSTEMRSGTGELRSGNSPAAHGRIP